jgi:16S rRNA (uracil1498-N3)-methyltransferase
MKTKVKNLRALSDHWFQRITCPAQLRAGREIALEGDPFSALVAREPLQGEIITITDATGKEFRGRIADLGNDGARCHIFEELTEPTEPPFDLFLFQALPAKERMELIIQKAVELGAKSIIPFKSQHSISLAQREAIQPKAHRWQQIALKAAKQCRRAIVPQVAPFCSFDKALEQARPLAMKLILLEKEEERLAPLIRNMPPPQGIALMVGPEGGWDEKEVEQARGEGFLSIGLGGRILRTETAAIAACAILQYEWGGL